jgi:hypothetical protein
VQHIADKQAGKCRPAGRQMEASSERLQNRRVAGVQKNAKGLAGSGQKVRKTAKNECFLAFFASFLTLF